MMDQLGTYSFKLSMRRFIQAMFENVSYQTVSYVTAFLTVLLGKDTSVDPIALYCIIFYCGAYMSIVF